MIETATSDAAQDRPGAPGAPGRVRVWDPLVRLVHWGVVALFAVVWLTSEASPQAHEIAGYAIAALVAVRLLWGIVGTRYARFAQFVKGRDATMAYIRGMLRGNERRYLGHNPAGAAMIVALLVALSGTAFTGWLIADTTRLAALADLPQIVSPALAEDGNGEGGGDSGGVLKDVHGALASLLMWLVVAHVGGVALASWRHHENLARAMVTGDKRAPGPGDIA